MSGTESKGEFNNGVENVSPMSFVLSCLGLDLRWLLNRVIGVGKTAIWFSLVRGTASENIFLNTINILYAKSNLNMRKIIRCIKHKPSTIDVLDVFHSNDNPLGIGFLAWTKLSILFLGWGFVTSRGSCRTTGNTVSDFSWINDSSVKPKSLIVYHT